MLGFEFWLLVVRLVYIHQIAFRLVLRAGTAIAFTNTFACSFYLYDS